MCVRCQIDDAVMEQDWDEVIKLATLAKFDELDADGYAPEPVAEPPEGLLD